MCVFVNDQDINVYNDRYYKEKVIFQDIAPCPYISKRL